MCRFFSVNIDYKFQKVVVSLLCIDLYSIIIEQGYIQKGNIQQHHSKFHIKNTVTDDEFWNHVDNQFEEKMKTKILLPPGVYWVFLFFQIFYCFVGFIVFIERSNQEKSSSCPEIFCKKAVLKNSVKFTGRHLSGSCRPATLSQKRLQPIFSFWTVVDRVLDLQLYQKDSGTGVFLWILRISENTSFTEHLWTTTSEHCKSNRKTLGKALGKT